MPSENKRDPNRVKIKDTTREQRNAYARKMRARRVARNPEKYAKLKHKHYISYRDKQDPEELKRARVKHARKWLSNPDNYQKHLRRNLAGYHRKKKEKAERERKEAEAKAEEGRR